MSAVVVGEAAAIWRAAIMSPPGVCRIRIRKSQSKLSGSTHEHLPTRARFPVC